jgi:hypothetical protein
MAFVDEPSHHLPVFEDEGRLVAAHLEHAACGHPMAEAGVEEARVVHPELADHGEVGGHFGGAVGRDVTASRLTRM